MFRVSHASPGTLIHRGQAHLAHQPTDMVTADTMPNSAQMSRHLTRAVKRRLHELLVDQAHQRQVGLTLANRGVIEPGPADPEQFALPDDRQMRVIHAHQLSPPHHAHRPEAFAKKSRSTTS